MYGNSPILQREHNLVLKKLIKSELPVILTIIISVPSPCVTIVSTAGASRRKLNSLYSFHINCSKLILPLRVSHISQFTSKFH